jgi:hypothetical protein
VGPSGVGICFGKRCSNMCNLIGMCKLVML